MKEDSGREGWELLLKSGKIHYWIYVEMAKAEVLELYKYFSLCGLNNINKRFKLTTEFGTDTQKCKTCEKILASYKRKKGWIKKYIAIHKDR